MKSLRNTLGMLVGLGLAATMSLVPAGVLAAGSGTFSVSGGGTYAAGSTFSVAIVENSGVNSVDSARAELSYNPSALQVVGFSTASNPFTTCATSASASVGHITTGDCTLLGGKKQGAQTLGTVTFKALASSGSASLSFTSMQLVDAGVDLAVSGINGSYSFKPAVVSATPTPAPAGPGSTKGSTPTPKPTTSSTPAAAAAGSVKGDQSGSNATSDNSDKVSSAANTVKVKSAKTFKFNPAWLWLVAIPALAATFMAGRWTRKTSISAK